MLNQQNLDEQTVRVGLRTRREQGDDGEKRNEKEPEAYGNARWHHFALKANEQSRGKPNQQKGQNVGTDAKAIAKSQRDRPGNNALRPHEHHGEERNRYHDKGNSGYIAFGALVENMAVAWLWRTLLRAFAARGKLADPRLGARIASLLFAEMPFETFRTFIVCFVSRWALRPGISY